MLGIERMKTRNCAHCGKVLTKVQKLCCSRVCNATFRGRLNAMNVEDRLWPRLRKEENGCWTWLGAKDWDGYGSLEAMGERRAHRIAWLLTKGEIPDGLWVLHKCDNPACCNPEHLWLGTAADNNADCKKKGRAHGPRGETSGHARLTEEQVLEIRRRAELEVVTQRQLAKDFGVGYKAICKIVNRQRWCHI